MNRRVGRVKIDFDEIERLAAAWIAAGDYVPAGWELSRKSSAHRRKDGSYTICLIWKGRNSTQFSATVRGVRL